jgi:hypothetical protein
VYYYHSRTGKSAWEIPASDSLSLEGIATPLPGPIDSDAAVTADDGGWYGKGGKKGGKGGAAAVSEGTTVQFDEIQAHEWRVTCLTAVLVGAFTPNIAVGYRSGAGGMHTAAAAIYKPETITNGANGKAAATILPSAQAVAGPAAAKCAEGDEYERLIRRQGMDPLRTVRQTRV